MNIIRFGIRGRLAAISILYPALAGLLAAGPAGAQTGAQPVIVVLGSSTAAGTGATNKDSSWVGRYTKALKARTSPWNVVNLGVGGYTTYHILPTGSPAVAGRPAPDTAHNFTKALTFKPLGIIVNMPSNDAASGYTAAQQKANYDTLAARAGRAGIAIWVCTSQPRTALIGDAAKKAAHIEVKDWIMTRFGAKSIDFWNGLALADASIDPQYGAGDGIHLNDKGHKFLFERVMAETIPEILEAPVALAGRQGSAPSRAFAALPRNLLAPGFPYDAAGRVLPLLRR